MGDAKDRKLRADLKEADALIAEASRKTEGLKLELEEQKQKTKLSQQEADEARVALDKHKCDHKDLGRFCCESLGRSLSNG